MQIRLLQSLSLVFFWLATADALAAEFDWEALPAGKWVVVPTEGEAAPKVFHGGATLVIDLDTVFFFGSDTHSPTRLEKGEANAVWRLNLNRLEWSQDYEQDPMESFQLRDDGQCVTESGRPWAMHTFDAVEYDPEVGRIVVVSFPVHARFRPAERFPAFSGNWFRQLQPSHWEYDPGSRTWTLLETDAPNLFAQALVWDSARKILIGHNGESTYHFARTIGHWRSYPAASSSAGYHLTMVYNSLTGQPLLLGRNGGSDVLYAYDPDRQEWAAVEVEGSTMPANGATMAFDTRNSVMLYLANDHDNQYHNPTGRAVTFIFHADQRRWERLKVESPELYGMNYLMQYDPSRNVFLHFEKSVDSDERLKLWVFRYR